MEDDKSTSFCCDFQMCSDTMAIHHRTSEAIKNCDEFTLNSQKIVVREEYEKKGDEKLSLLAKAKNYL